MDKPHTITGDIANYAEGSITIEQQTFVYQSSEPVDRNAMLSEILEFRKISDTHKQLLNQFALVGYGSTFFKTLDDKQLCVVYSHFLLLKKLVDGHQELLGGAQEEIESMKQQRDQYRGMNDTLIAKRCWICRLRKISA